MKKTITLSVSDFALPSPLTGSIDSYSGFGPGQAFGIQIHHQVQEQRLLDNPNYEAEVWTEQKFLQDKYAFEIIGKMDGVYHQEPFKIEEIKTAFDVKKLLNVIKENEDHPYLLQLKTYGFFYWLKTKTIPELNLHLVSSRNRKSIDQPISLDISKYKEWLSRRLHELAQAARFTEKLIRKRKKIGKRLTFPFPTARAGQKQLMESVHQGMKQNQRILIQAPTGLGKTMGILFPALVESLQRGQKVIYLTPKNSQHLVALDAFKHINEASQTISALVLTAKKKICMKQEPICNADYCEFAENHYTKITENDLIPHLQKEQILTAASFKRIAEEHKVCPYELQMEMVTNVDTVICDYNYVFSPRSPGTRIAKLRIAESEKPNVVIDELHNLPVRAMEYYSPGMSVIVFEKATREINKLPLDLQERFKKLLIECITIIESCAVAHNAGPHLITPPTQIFSNHELLLRDFLISYLESDAVIGSNDIVLTIYNYWADFTAALEWVSTSRKEFFTTFYTDPPTVKITCCDASEMLKACYDNFKQVIGFSATLKPFEFYSQLIGLFSTKLKTEEFTSPFPKQKRKLILIPQVSSKYSERLRNYPRIAEAIAKITTLKKGNYFAFFPSFDFMENVFRNFQPASDFQLICQHRGMLQKDVQKILSLLGNDEASHIIFAVQGGVLAEGIDYPGKLAIGAFVIGTPLPNYNWERERMKEYYQSQYGKGEEYAYIFPAMAKAIQAAGRVIRSEIDKGLIVLMDDRFLHQNYYQCMPNDWFDRSPNEIISTSILNDIKQFWLQE